MIQVKRLARRVLHRLGLDLIRHPPLPERNSLNAHLMRALTHCPVDGVVDVGAHEGGFATRMRQDVGFRGPIVSFEPVDSSFRQLTAAMSGDPSWEGKKLALGAQSGVLPLNVHSSSDFNSLRTASTYGQQQFEVLRSGTSEYVEVRRLDDVLELAGRLLLKLDTQGFDLEVMRGATNTLRRIDILVVEVAAISIYEGAPTMLEMMEKIQESGFFSAGMSLVSLDGARAIEYDAVFVRF
jgi:FkbM family methyltransferase